MLEQLLAICQNEKDRGEQRGAGSDQDHPAPHVRAEHGGNQSHRRSGTVPLARFSTHDRSTAHSKECFAIWVCSPSGIFFTANHVVSEFPRSTFLGGTRVLAAGEWVVSAGKILLISHKTGHHAAGPANLYNALRQLESRVDLSRTAALLRDFAKNQEVYVTVQEFLAKGGRVAECTPIAGDVAAGWRVYDAVIARWPGADGGFAKADIIAFDPAAPSFAR